MYRHLGLLAVVGGSVFFGSLANPLAAQSAKPATASPKPIEATIASALAADLTTAPYSFLVERKDGRVHLKGRVGSRIVHDAAIRIAIASGLPVADDLVIDTNEAIRVASLTGGISPASAALVSSYTFPPPLFGRFDDPFFGLEPPLVTYPFYWPELTARRRGQSESVSTVQEADPTLPPNTIEMTIDPLGVALLRGTVPTQADRIAVGQRSALMPGVTGVINRLTVASAMRLPTKPAPRPLDDEPPPPPTPVSSRPQPRPNEPKTMPIVPKPGIEPVPAPPLQSKIDPLGNRLETAVRSRPELAASSLKVTSSGGVARLSGSVPTVYEAMLAFRAAQQTPGVKEVVDTLQFEVPDGRSPNPLLAKGKPEDVEPYLQAQIARQVGDAARIDRVKVSGDTLQVFGTVVKSDVKPRVQAVLRSMPILRGFNVLPEFRSVE